MRTFSVLKSALILAVSILGIPLMSWAFKTPGEDLTAPVESFNSQGESTRAVLKHKLKPFEIRPTSKGLAGKPEIPSARARLDELMQQAHSEAKELRSFTDKLGYKHARMGQFHKGLRVVGAEIIVHSDDQESVYQIDGKYLTDLDVDTTPVLSEDDALQIGLSEQAGKPDLKVAVKPSLAIYKSELAYEYVISHGGKNPGKWHYYVDAKTGELIERYNEIRYAIPTRSGSYLTVTGNLIPGEGGAVVRLQGWRDSTGSYFLYNRFNHWGVYDERAKDWERKFSRYWGTVDRSAISAAHSLSLAERWVKNVLLRNSFNNKGGFARVNIHTGNRYVNAYWDGTDFHFGDGDGVEAGYMTALDIVAHEFGHAITQYTSRLSYSGEAGALDESYSDIMGTAVEWASQSVDLSGSPGHADWMLGEDASISEPATRDMSNPKLFGQPSYYKGECWYSGSADNGGVHTNSGVQNFAFYLLANGGNGTNEGHSYSITGVGVNAAARIAWRANTVYLTSRAKYADSRRAWISAARDLGFSTANVEVVWDAVGVKAN